VNNIHAFRKFLLFFPCGEQGILEVYFTMDCCLFTGTVYWYFIISAGNIMLIERYEADIYG